MDGVDFFPLKFCRNIEVDLEVKMCYCYGPGLNMTVSIKNLSKRGFMIIVVLKLTFSLNFLQNSVQLKSTII